MTSQITKIRSESPDAILLWAAGAEAATVLKNNASLGGSDPLPVWGGPGNARIELIEGAGAAADGFTFSAGKILLPEAYGEGTEEYAVATGFIERFTDAYSTPPDIFAGHAYDAFHIIIEAMKRLDEGFTSAELRDEIERTEGLIGVGGVFTFGPDDHNGLSASDMTLYRVRDGKWTLAEEAK